MEIVIKIPKVMYINAQNDQLFGSEIIVDAIKNGTPLPKEHGRLIDADDAKTKTDMGVVKDWIDMQPTVLEARR